MWAHEFYAQIQYPVHTDKNVFTDTRTVFFDGFQHTDGRKYMSLKYTGADRIFTTCARSFQ